MKLQKENPAGCAGEGKQNKGNIGEEKRKYRRREKEGQEINKRTSSRMRWGR